MRKNLGQGIIKRFDKADRRQNTVFVFTGLKSSYDNGGNQVTASKKPLLPVRNSPLKMDIVV